MPALSVAANLHAVKLPVALYIRCQRPKRWLYRPEDGKPDESSGRISGLGRRRKKGPEDGQKRRPEPEKDSGEVATDQDETLRPGDCIPPRPKVFVVAASSAAKLDAFGVANNDDDTESGDAFDLHRQGRDNVTLRSKSPAGGRGRSNWAAAPADYSLNKHISGNRIALFHPATRPTSRLWPGLAATEKVKETGVRLFSPDSEVGDAKARRDPKCRGGSRSSGQAQETIQKRQRWSHKWGQSAPVARADLHQARRAWYTTPLALFSALQDCGFEFEAIYRGSVTERRDRGTKLSAMEAGQNATSEGMTDHDSTIDLSKGPSRGQQTVVRAGAPRSDLRLLKDLREM
ncbi:hypothetical protein C8R46DRAFT_1024894 [Mycena filopes]|nr:hypothetical protein C8R46DRAFT_1024894 [Mycena filopes]